MLFQGRSFSGRERNCCFLNTGRGRYADISAVSGLDFPDDGRGLAVVDWDHDGGLDLWVTNRNAPRLRFLRNNAAVRGGYLALLLKGNGTTTNRDAIGARVEVVLSDQKDGKLIKTLRAGEGFLSQSSKWLHFGLGEAETVRQLVVHWPGGAAEEFSGVQVDRRYVLVQGTGKPEAWQMPPRQIVLRPSSQDPSIQAASSAAPEGAKVSLVARLPMLRSAYRQFDGADRLLPVGGNKPLLLNLWASWCAPCLAELKDWSDHEEQLRAAGIEIVALCVDGIGDDSSDPAAAETYLSRVQFPYLAGRATPEIVQNVQSIHNRVIPAHRPLPLPTSLLIDESGHLSVIYKGRVAAADVIDDASRTVGTRAERRLRAGQLAGRLIDHERVARTAENGELKILFRLADDLQKAGRLDDAARYYREVLKLRPEIAEIHNNLGTVAAGQGDWPAAVRLFEEAIRLRPGYAQARFNLGAVLEQQQQLAAAAAEYENALELQPDYLEARYNLGNVYAAQGEWRKAAVQYEAVLRERPDHDAARSNLKYVEVQLERVR